MKTSQPFYIEDNQCSRYMGDGTVFNSLRQAIIYLKEYHSIDLTCYHFTVSNILDMERSFFSLQDEDITKEIVGDNIDKVYRGSIGNFDKTELYFPGKS